MNADPKISQQGNDPHGAVQRLGHLIDQITTTCPNATVLVAMIIPTMQNSKESSQGQEDRTKIYNSLIPGIVADKQQNGGKVITVDFSKFPTTAINEGGVHLTSQGYSLMGDWWYDFIHQIPNEWIEGPAVQQLKRPKCTNKVDMGANGGPDPNIKPPVFPPSAIKASSPDIVSAAAAAAGTGGYSACRGGPHWHSTGQIAEGYGHNGDWQYHKNWVQEGKMADGIHRGSSDVHLADINNDGRDDYLWVRTYISLG